MRDGRPRARCTTHSRNPRPRRPSRWYARGCRNSRASTGRGRRGTGRRIRYGAAAARRKKESWKKARRAWEEKLQADKAANDAGSRIREERAETRARNEADREARRSSRALEKQRNFSITERVRKFQKHVISNVFVMGMLFVINVVTSGDFPWFIFPWLGLSIGIAAHAFALWQDGILLRDVFRRPSHLAQREAPAIAPASAEERGFDAASRARTLAGEAVYAGVHGGAVRRAVEDERAVQEILKSLSPADRAQLPDLEPTVRSLLDRVVSIAQALHALDADVSADQITRLDARLAEAKALPEGASDRERRIGLLERQRTSLEELVNRRTSLADQLENATLVLQTMRLDLLRLRSAGIGNAASDLNSVTQEARAVSRDIGRVLDAAAEVRKL